MPTLPEFNLDGKVAIVTGAAQGIGKGIAKSLAQAGADIVLAGISLGDRENDDAAMQSAAEEIKQVGNKVLPITADMRVLEDVENLIDQTLNTFGGKLDIMVNNAGGSFNNHFIRFGFDFEPSEDLTISLDEVILMGEYSEKLAGVTNEFEFTHLSSSLSAMHAFGHYVSVKAYINFHYRRYRTRFDNETKKDNAKEFAFGGALELLF